MPPGVLTPLPRPPGRREASPDISGGTGEAARRAPGTRRRERGRGRGWGWGWGRGRAPPTPEVVAEPPPLHLHAWAEPPDVLAELPPKPWAVRPGGGARGWRRRADGGRVPPVSAGLLAGHPASYKDSPPGGEPGGHPHASDPFRSTPPCAEPPLPRGDGRELMYRWMKHEPLGPYLDEGEAEKELEREEKAESPPAAPQPRYPSVESNDLEPDNSTSEDTGSSEGPSPGDALDRYCNHLGYEPESLGDNLYVCIPCGKGFPSSEQLNAHVEAHNEEELYHKAAAEQAVPFLDKGGPGLGDILHLGLKPFACDACGMRFTRQYRLTEHMRIHSGEKPYECQVCGGKFAQQRNLISHMKMHAAGPDGKAKLDFPDSVYAMARLTADQLGLKQEKAAELLSHTSHFLSDPKAMESLYPLAKFTAEHLGDCPRGSAAPSPPPGPAAAPGTGAGGEAQAVTPG
uniref:HIC ZBTB transcriptional repressor 1 n=1 Tax=Anser brachyrhynchus TaxID=132585 RepID=A0A8B9C2Y9_9AVES